MHLFVGDSWLQGIHHSSVRLEDYVVDLSLLLGELAVDWEADSDIRAVVVNLMALVSQNHMAILAPLVVVVVVESGGSGTTATNRQVRLDSATKVLLLTVVGKE